VELERQARKAVEGGRVILVSYRGRSHFFVVKSSDRKKAYIVYPGEYCSCPDYLFSVFLGGRRRTCYHLLAADIALREKRYRELEVNSEAEWRKLYGEILAGFIK